MLSVLQDNSAENTKYLFNVVKNLKITKCDGENVETVASLIHGVVSCLSNLVYSNGQSELLDDFDDYLLDIFNTTSIT